MAKKRQECVPLTLSPAPKKAETAVVFSGFRPGTIMASASPRRPRRPASASRVLMPYLGDALRLRRSPYMAPVRRSIPGAPRRYKRLRRRRGSHSQPAQQQRAAESLPCLHRGLYRSCSVIEWCGVQCFVCFAWKSGRLHLNRGGFGDFGGDGVVYSKNFRFSKFSGSVTDALVVQ